MAATRLIALHKNKGKSVAACLKSRTDYVQSPDKTEQGELVSCHECSPDMYKRQICIFDSGSQKKDRAGYVITDTLANF